MKMHACASPDTMAEYLLVNGEITALSRPTVTLKGEAIFGHVVDVAR